MFAGKALAHWQRKPPHPAFNFIIFGLKTENNFQKHKFILLSLGCIGQ
jgi:hypothetical protein